MGSTGVRGSRWVLAVLGMAILSGCGGTAVPSGPPSPTAGAGAAVPVGGDCPAPGALIALGSDDAAMGLRVQTIELANCGSRPLVIKGYPALRVLDEQHEPLDIQILNGSTAVALIPGFDTPPAELTLQPGDKAVAGLVWRNTYTESTDPPVNGSFLQIAPAAGDAWQTLTPRARIDLGNTGRLGVTAWGPAPAPSPTAPSPTAPSPTVPPR